MLSDRGAMGKKKEKRGLIAETAGTLAAVAPPVIGSLTPHPVAGAVAGAAITRRYGDDIEEIVGSAVQKAVEKSNENWDNLSEDELRDVAFYQGLNY